ncbi:protein phosphatase [Ereboglobus sp. PH5-10]|uniref:polynucleotide kinase-phosphatase n=1 Tax=Ereboglobus sp. PH5-10 TaxID=2940629 RepID=UPI0024071460|nr:polynucleotide kinase-phosphatase [Ereboglobus sp. PH5-10]MDF9828164.1 protein phosphatase [Ereboglobus sp. PH5-10]
MKITIPELSLVVLIGVSGSGKSTFARKHFKSTEILSSDHCRALVSDDENDQSATSDAFEVLHYIARKRLAAGRLTVIDATNVQPESRKSLVALAREYHCLPVALVLNIPERLAHDRNKTRPDRAFGPHVVRQQSQQLRRSLRNLQREGFRHIHIWDTPEQIDGATIERQPLWNNLKREHGPFDIVGDIHGCYDELVALLRTLDYTVDETSHTLAPPPGRKLIFLGDLVDRGPKIPDVLKLAMNAVASGAALCVPGNHDVKLMRKLRGRDVQITHGLADSLAQLSSETDEFRVRVADFIDKLVSHYVLDDGRLVVAHAGMKQNMQGRGSGAVREFALYGETTGETDEFGLPIRYNWAAEYRGSPMVVYGHTPVPEPEWLNRTINIDTGCVFGGKLTALRYPEKEIVSVPSIHAYAEPRKPFLPETAPTPSAPALSAQQQHDDLLDLADVTGKRIVATRLHGNVTIREENATAALEVMSRFAANPKWLIYLPPTMSPCETSGVPGLLEHPAEAFAYYRHAGIPRVICEEKHMGSRAVVIVCRDEAAALKTFGITGEGIGICYTRTGRRFFDDAKLEAAFLARVHAAATAADYWNQFQTSWLCFDCELMPWSAKARELLKQQYAAVGAAARASLAGETEALEQTSLRGLDVGALLARTIERRQMAEDYIAAYQRYCWPVNGIDDYKLAPFHLLATEGNVHADKPHDWHMQTLAALASPANATAGNILIATPHRIIDVTNPASEAEGIEWWEQLTARGGEGMVVKPLDFIAKGKRGLIQPAVKCRGREYLRIIYGPEYTAPENISRLRARSLAAKRSLALREFALGIESLERFVRKEPLRRVHEAVFGVLALESEPVDPRL